MHKFLFQFLDKPHLRFVILNPNFMGRNYERGVYLLFVGKSSFEY